MAGDRRIEFRNPTSEVAEVLVPDENGVQQSHTGMLSNLSRSGGRVQLDRAIRADTKVRIKVREYDLSAHVRSSVRLPAGGYSLGIEFDEEYPGMIRPVK